MMRNPVWLQARDLIRSHSERLEHVYEESAMRTIVVYRLKYRSPGPAKPLQFEVSTPFSRFLPR
jgi:hypothetical protein